MNFVRNFSKYASNELTDFSRFGQNSIRKRIAFALITQKTLIFTDFSLTKLIRTKTNFVGIHLGPFG